MPNKLIETIRAKQTGKLAAVPISMLSFQENISEPAMPDHRYEYEYRCIFGYKGYALEIEEVEFVKEKGLQLLCEEVYGQFRRPLLEAAVAINHMDDRKALDLISGILDDMFKV